MKRQLVILTLSLLFGFKAYAQQITGTVFELNASNKEIRLEGASISWINTSIGVISNAQGEFVINTQGITDSRLIIFLDASLSESVTTQQKSHLKID